MQLNDKHFGFSFISDTGCKSWFGQEYVKCHNDTNVCTLPKFQDTDCHSCDEDVTKNQTLWRCNSGLCINELEVQSKFSYKATKY